MPTPIGAPTPEQLVAEMLAKQRTEAEAEHQRRMAEWEAAQRAKFEEELRAEKERIRRQHGYDPLSVFLAQRYEYVARQRFESALQTGKSRLQEEFEQSWKRYEETVKPSLLESARFWVGLGYPQYAGKYAPVKLPEGAVITSVYETAEGIHIQYKTREQIEAERRAREGQERLERLIRESAERWKAAGFPEYAGKYLFPEIPEGAKIMKVEETAEGLRIEYMTKEQLEAQKQIEEQKQSVEQKMDEQVKASIEFWESVGRPEYGGRYAPIELPEGAVITKVEETAEGLRIEYMTREQLEEMRKAQEAFETNREKWVKFGLEEYGSKYQFPSELEGYRVTGKTTIPGVGEAYVAYDALMLDYMREMETRGKALPRPDFSVQPTYIRFEETAEGLQVYIYDSVTGATKQTHIQGTVDALKMDPTLYKAARQIQQAKQDMFKADPTLYRASPQSTGETLYTEKIEMKRFQEDLARYAEYREQESERLLMDLGLYEYAGKYLVPSEILGHQVVGKTTLPGIGEAYVLRSGTGEEKYLKIDAAGGLLLFTLIEKETFEKRWASEEFWKKMGLEKYAGKYEPVSELEGWEPAGFYYAGGYEFMLLRRGQETIYVRFEETPRGLNIYRYTREQIEEMAKPKLKTMSTALYEWAESINIPGLEGLAKHLVGIFSFVIDIPAYNIAKALTNLSGGEMLPTTFPPVEDIAYSSGFLSGGLLISVLSGGIAGIPTATTLKLAAVSGAISATAAGVYSAVTGQPITPGQLIHTAAKGIAYAGIGQAGFALLAKAAPAVAAGTVTGKMAQVGYAGAFGAGVGYIETGDVRRALIAGGISAGLAALILFGAQPLYHEIKARLGRTVRLEPAGKTIGAGGREAEVYEAYLKDLDMRLRVVADLTERPVGAAGVTRESLIQEYIGRKVGTAHSTLQFGKFAKPGEDILLRGFPEQAAGLRRELQLYHFYSAPGDEKTITVYGAYMGLGGDYAGARVVFGGQPGVIATTGSYVSPESLIRPGETITEYLWRISTSTGKVYIAPETVLGWSAERQLITPAAYERFGVQLPGTYYHVERVLPQTFEVVQYPSGLLGKIPVLRSMLARYFDFRVAVGEFRPVPTGAEAIAPTQISSAAISTQPVVHISPAAISVSSIAAITSSAIISASTSVNGKIMSKPAVYEAKPISAAKIVSPTSASTSVLRSQTQISVSQTSAPLISISPVATSTQKSLSQAVSMPAVISMISTVKHVGVASPRTSLAESIKETSAAPTASTASVVSSTLASAVKPSFSSQAGGVVLVSPVITPFTHESASPEMPKPRQLMEWAFPAWEKKIKPLGFIYERPRPITAVEEQIRKLKRDLKVDPHVFLAAPELSAKKKVKADVRHVSDELSVSVFGKATGRGRARVEMTLTESVMKGLRRVKVSGLPAEAITHLREAKKVLKIGLTPAPAKPRRGRKEK